jgi:hypothetical protein
MHGLATTLAIPTVAAAVTAAAAAATAAAASAGTNCGRRQRAREVLGMHQAAQLVPSHLKRTFMPHTQKATRL